MCEKKDTDITKFLTDIRRTENTWLISFHSASEHFFSTKEILLA